MKPLLIDAQYVKFKILRFVHGKKGRVVGRLRSDFDKAHPPAAFFCAFDNHFLKQRRRHVVRTRRRDEIPALFDKFQPQNVDVLVSPVRVAYFRRAFRERGGSSTTTPYFPFSRFLSRKYSNTSAHTAFTFLNPFNAAFSSTAFT